MLRDHRHRNAIGSIALVLGGGLFLGILSPPVGATVIMLSLMTLGLLSISAQTPLTAQLDGPTFLAGLALFLAAAIAPSFGETGERTLATVAGFGILALGLTLILWEDTPGGQTLAGDGRPLRQRAGQDC